MVLFGFGQFDWQDFPFFAKSLGREGGRRARGRDVCKMLREPFKQLTGGCNYLLGLSNYININFSVFFVEHRAGGEEVKGHRIPSVHGQESQSKKSESPKSIRLLWHRHALPRFICAQRTQPCWQLLVDCSTSRADWGYIPGATSGDL